MKKLTLEDVAAGWTLSSLERYYTLHRELLARRYTEREALLKHHVAMRAAAYQGCVEKIDFGGFTHDDIWAERQVGIADVVRPQERFA